MTELAEVTSRAGTTTQRTDSARNSYMEAVRATLTTSGRRKSAKTFAVVRIPGNPARRTLASNRSVNIIFYNGCL